MLYSFDSFTYHPQVRIETSMNNSNSKKRADETYVGISGTLKSHVDKVWNVFWSNGIANPLSIVEHISYLLFLKQLSTTDIKIPEVFVWASIVKEKDARQLTELLKAGFEYCKNDIDIQTEYRLFSMYQEHMKDAVFLISNPTVLQKVVHIIDQLPVGRDTIGDLYEYMLHKISVSGQNGQFRTPRHIIEMMVKMVEPTSTDVICDPACGSAGFLLIAAEYVKEKNFKTRYVGYDFDRGMLRIATMNMILHEIEDVVIEYRNALSREHISLGNNNISLILANPPFTGTVVKEEIHPELLSEAKTTKSELLFLHLFFKILKTNGRAAVVVPDGVLFGSGTAHVNTRKKIIEDHKLQGVVSLPSGVFQPYSGVSTSILFFQKTDCGGTDRVWFYHMKHDGFSLNATRTPTEQNDIPDIVNRWKNRLEEQESDRTSNCFFVPKSEIVANNYDLSFRRYQHIDYEEEEYQSSHDILDELKELSNQIQEKLSSIQGLLP